MGSTTTSFFGLSEPFCVRFDGITYRVYLGINSNLIDRIEDRDYREVTAQLTENQRLLLQNRARARRRNAGK